MIGVAHWGNAPAVVRALVSRGVAAKVVYDGQEAAACAGLVLPGVGHAGTVMATLRASGVLPALWAHVRNGRPVVGICVGGQVLCERSDEGATECIGILPGTVRKGSGLYVGWREVEGVGVRYFCHEYAMPADRMRQGSVVAYQYHPEKSGPAGLRELAAVFGA